jgi:hypothetical protein
MLTLPSVAFGNRKALPTCPAIYFVLNAQGTVLYIGQSSNLATRWATHHQAGHLRTQQATRIAWLVMDDVTLLNAVEAACIAYFAPACNDVRRPVDPARPWKKRGPQPKGYVNVHIHVDPDLLEWAKQKPEGFAGLVRRLLQQEHARDATP